MKRGRRALLVACGLALGLLVVAGAELVVRATRGDELALLSHVVRDGEAWVERDRPLWQLTVAPGDSLDRVACRVAKPTGVVRVVVVGESTAAGYPFAPKLSFGRLVEAALGDGARSAGRSTIEVVNFARAGDSSDHVRQVAIEALALAPDVIVVCSGHNDFQGSYATDLEDGLWPRLRAQLRRLALVRIGSERVVSRAAAAVYRPPSTNVADAPFLTESERARGADRFRENLAAIADAAQSSGAALLVMTQVANLSDPPNASSFHASLPVATREEFRRLLAELDAALAERTPAPAATIARLRELDPDVARFQFTVACLAERDGDLVAARAAYERALELDGSPDRVGGALNGVVRELCASGRARLVDAQAFFAALPPAVAPGRSLFLDYCHPDAAGIALLAEALLPPLHAALAERRVALPPLDVALARLRRPLSEQWAELSLTDEALAEGSLRAGRVLAGNSPARARDAFLLALRIAPGSKETVAALAALDPTASPAVAAKQRLDAVTLFVLARGNRPQIGRDEWRVIGAWMDEVATRDGALFDDPVCLALRGAAAAGIGEFGLARTAFARIAREMPEAWPALAKQARELPALHAVFKSAGVEIAESRGDE